jgi:UDP-GlcNAc:undecaprenyl-phosphate/decaprenyl-phosphate GlcNAc-1-phosphate transferase
VTVILFLAGLVLAPAAWLLLAPAFAQETFSRENYRGHVLPTAAGMVIPVVVLAAVAVLLLAATAGVELDGAGLQSLWLGLVLSAGFALLGLFDDLGGTGESGGFRGHLRSLATGRLTTGSVKLFGGAALAVATVAVARPPEDPGAAAVARLLADAALIALAANLANLFDRAPGRVVKISTLLFVVLAAATVVPTELAGPALVAGAGLGLLRADLGEHLMLGDTGANVLGAGLGLGVVLACSSGLRTGVLVVVLALNLISERISFSRVIARVGPLRFVDHLGRGI